MGRETYWTNKDGLNVGYGTRTVETTGSARVPAGDSRRQQIVMKITGADLADADVSAQLVHAPVIPAGALLEKATLVVKTLFVGATATLDVGIYKAGVAGTDDDDGIDAAVAVAALVAGADIACDGAAIGTVLDADYKVGASYDTAAFTAGEAEVVIEYLVPAAV